ncbi:MAG TPA: hypothetical protein VIO16_04995 [Dehalococcoidia bacterium]
MTSDAGPSDRTERARATIIPSCSERYFFEWIYPYARFGTWGCTYCGDPIEYTADGTVYIGRLRLSCRIEDLRGFPQLGPNDGAPVSVNRCCSDRISAADQVMALGRAVQCPICGDTYTSAMITRWQGSSQVKGYVRDGQGFAVDHNLAVPALIPVERLSSRVY